jgi:hypothetical protein
MKWYFAYNGCTELGQFPLIRMAVNSARRHTDLEPHCIVSGPRGPCVDWLERQGVVVHSRDIPILGILRQYKETHPDYDIVSARGAYLRLEISQIEQREKFILYTDTDVLFRSIDGLGQFRPWIVAVAPEFDQKGTDKNTGVMVINVPRFRRWVDRIYEFTVGDPGKMSAHDQTAICQVLRPWRKQRLDPQFNWKPYWGFNSSARIVHWHGPKPVHAEAMINGDFGDMPEVYRTLFRRDARSYHTYVAIAQEYSSE